MPLLMGQLKEDWIGNGDEIEGMTSSKGPQGGIEPRFAAARTQPLCIGRPLHQLSYQGTNSL